MREKTILKILMNQNRAIKLLLEIVFELCSSANNYSDSIARKISEAAEEIKNLKETDDGND